MEPFLSLWREVRVEAVAAASWKAATDCVRTLQNDLRAERTRNLRKLTDSSVRALLDDVGLHITGLTVKGTKADVQVVDANGQPVRLALLSAGQRNALLLAPCSPSPTAAHSGSSSSTTRCTPSTRSVSTGSPSSSIPSPPTAGS